MRQPTDHLGRLGLPCVLRHPSGAELTVGEAASTSLLEQVPVGRVTIVDLKQQPGETYGHELIWFP